MSRLVASPESTNLLPRQGARGFPHWGRWSEACRYVTDDLWTYMMAAPTPREHLGKVATRLTGEGARGRVWGPWECVFGASPTSIVCPHTGATLARFTPSFRLHLASLGCLSGSHDIFGPSWDAGLPGNLAAGRRPSFSWVRCLPHGVGSLREICEKGPREALRLRTLISLIMLAPGVPLVPLGLDGDLPDSLLDLPKLLRVLASFRARHISLLQPESFDNQMVRAPERAAAFLCDTPLLGDLKRDTESLAHISAQSTQCLSRHAYLCRCLCLPHHSRPPPPCCSPGGVDVARGHAHV